jgi:hypothetical protein
MLARRSHQVLAPAVEASLALQQRLTVREESVV